MDVEKLEQLAAVIVTAGLVAGNFLLFTPWRDGQDPRQRQPGRFLPQNESLHLPNTPGPYLTSMGNFSEPIHPCVLINCAE